MCMQEGVAVEVAEAVIQSLKGELSSNTVNAPMVAPETLKELQPYIILAQGLGKIAVQLVADQGFAGVHLLLRQALSVMLRFALVRQCQV
jgi:D-3-phosphoglycerate dehydrogenase / 2-oxoglutarate reductase